MSNTDSTKNTTQKTKKMSNTDPTKNTTQKTKKMNNTFSFLCCVFGESVLLIFLVFCVVFLVGSMLLIFLVFCVVFLVESVLLSFLFAIPKICATFLFVALFNLAQFCLIFFVAHVSFSDLEKEQY
jgi:energy-coupling factor transporter transmembrane protein EcfT